MDNEMESTVNKITELVGSTASKLQKVWEEIGFDEDTLQGRRRNMVKHVKILMTQMMDEENNLKISLVKSIEDNGPRFYHLKKELGAHIPEPEEHLTLFELEHYLRRSVQEMDREVKARRKELEDLRIREQELCDCLKEEPCIIEKRTIPTGESIKDLQRVIRTLEQEKVDRMKTFSLHKAKLKKLLEDLEQTPATSFECSVVSGLEELFTLSTENLRRIKALNEEYERRVEDNSKESVEVKEKIRLLSDRLGHDPIERDSFLASVVDHTPSSLKKLYEELEHLEDLKKSNMGNFIGQLRQELEMLWEKCYISVMEREAFLPYTSEEQTEEVLEAHNVEVERLKSYFEENKKFYSALDHWHQLWSKHMDLEERSNDPNRLFGNRGCALLQEEKERRRVKAELPRVEKELEDLAKEYEASKGQVFRVKGRVVSDYLLDHWHSYHDQREQEKKERQSARTKYLLSETQSSSNSSSSRAYPHSSKTLKRHLWQEGGGKWSKLRCISENTTPEASTTSSCVITTPLPVQGRSVLRERNHMTLRNRGTEKDKSSGSSSHDLSSYSNFSKTLHQRSRRENVRSSAIYGLSKTPVPASKRISPRRLPQGLPKTPKTLPRAAPHRSPRLNTSRAKRLTGSNTTAASPCLSAVFRSPHRVSRSNTTTTPSRWSKVSFLI